MLSSSESYHLDWILQEGQGRQDRKLAVAWHRRRNGRSEFIVAQNPNGIFCNSDESFLGSITANLMGSKYQIWDQVVDISAFMLKFDTQRERERERGAHGSI